MEGGSGWVWCGREAGKAATGWRAKEWYGSELGRAGMERGTKKQAQRAYKRQTTDKRSCTGALGKEPGAMAQTED